MAEKIIFCPHCKQTLSIDEQYLSMEIECPICNKNFIAETTVKNDSPVSVKFEFVKKINDSVSNIKNHFNYNNQNLTYITGNESPDDLDISKCRKICKNYFSGLRSSENIGNFLSIIGNFFEHIFFIILIIRSIFKKNPLRVVKCFRRLRNSDIAFLNNLDILSRYGKNKEQLVSSDQTLFVPAIADDEESDFKYDLIDTGDGNFEYIYSTESVTKIYTFEDQLFVYNGLWNYTVGQIIHESTKAFFFKDITNISSTNKYEEIDNDEQPFDFKGNFLKIIEFYKNHWKKIAVLLILISTATIFFHFSHREKNELIDRYTDNVKTKISKRLDTLPSYSYYGSATKLNNEELLILKDYKSQLQTLKKALGEKTEESNKFKDLKQSFMKDFLARFKKQGNENKLKKRFDEIINDYRDIYEIELNEFDLDFLQAYHNAGYGDGKRRVTHEFIEKYLKQSDVVKDIEWSVSQILWECFATDILVVFIIFVIVNIVSCIIFMLIKFLSWCFADWGSDFFRKSESLTITAKSGDKITITMLCDEWLEANHGILTGQRSDGEKIFHAIRKMIEEKKVSANE